MMPVTKCWRVANVKPALGSTLMMLQIALAPAPVARREIDQRGRAFLEAAAKRRQHVDRPAGAADQRRLDEIVAEDVAAERRLARQVGHAAMVGEGASADDRVMAPVIAVAAHPGGQARGQDRARQRARRTAAARANKRVAVDDQRQALDDAGVRVVLHRVREPARSRGRSSGCRRRAPASADRRRPSG